MKDVVVVFARAPRLGAVKRRLAAGIGARAALRFHRAMLARLLRMLCAGRSFDTVLALTPGSAARPGFWHGFSGRPARRPALIGQGGGDLGARMQRAARRFRHRRLLIVGCDIPGLQRDDIDAARRALGRAEAVFGPAEDGGYWLVGLGPRRPAHPFAAVRWSGPHALGDTLANFLGRRIALLRTLRDVDTPQDWRALMAARWR